MLEEYRKKYAKAVIQYLVINIEGDVVDSSGVLFSKVLGKNITEIHPFFESLTGLLDSKNEEFTFSCIHIEASEGKIIADIILKTFEGDTSPLITIHDLTDHYNDYQSTAQVRNESVIGSEVLEIQNKHLKEKESFKNTFIANFSHELRDPLTGIITFSNILSKTHLVEEQLDYLRILKNSSTFLKKLIDDILDITKIETGKLDLIIEPFDFLELIEDLKFNYNIKAQQKGLEFHYNFSNNLPKIIGGDVYRLRQVLTNLLDNAIKFTNTGSVTFNVSLNQIRAQKASIYFEVIDTGIGIKPEDQEAIFNSFSQVYSEEVYKGNGLGLSIAKHLVGLTKSKINVVSEFGKGATFSTSINFIANPSLKTEKKITTTDTELNTSKKYSVLLVEDSEITQLSILKILASRGNFFVDIVTEPDDVIAKITNYDQEFDLVLMDIKLKENKGDEIAKLIRKLPERQHKKIPIIAVTAKIFKEDLKQFKKAGINDVVKKPFNETTLLETMAKYLK